MPESTAVTAYTVPAAGVLTSWRAQAPAQPHADPMKFKVFHPTGNPHEHTVLAESALENPTGGGLASLLIRVPVQAGDLIGLYSHGNNGQAAAPDRAEAGSHPTFGRPKRS